MYDIIRFLSASETSFGRSELDLPVMQCLPEVKWNNNNKRHFEVM